MIETRTVLTDDIDKRTTANVETRTFMLDGTEYAIELGTVNYGKLRKDLAAYIEHARKASNGKPSNGKHPRTNGKDTSKRNNDIREWAKALGYEVNARGRIPSHIIAEFDTAS